MRNYTLLFELRELLSYKNTYTIDMFEKIYIILYVFVLHMVTKIVPIRLKEEELKQIDELVEYGIFQSRCEAIRELIKIGIDNLTYLSEVFEAVKKLFELEKIEGKIPIDLSGATEQLLRERER